MTEAISIDIWSDIACPWCYIGKRNLEKGLEAVASDDDAPQVDITFHSFELSPDTPVDFDGDEIDFLAGHKGMPREQVEQMLSHVTGVAEGAGLAYRFDLLQHTNTVKAHELLHFAKAQGVQHEMEERLMSAYFTEGKHVGRIDDLVELAVEVGLNPDDAREALVSARHLADVRQDQAQAQAYGIQGVPFFVIDGQYGISGAQPPAAFENVLRDLWAKRGDAAAEPETAAV
ncbi:putative DsbA family dithiol-disulfide isomerase [Microbacterium phyllosphaerae]|uniref:DsbA family dithiol-disulfide isomerase n=1 Tax=Microbacterium phyllosphaerae TaxID=124798 RepID=A0ABS4WS64_9MICO|nr:DsbA family oxidoreductase [Microbacterium phyllosphaerae]MBP2379062.1 putative DsbA family dithiol-disulfide isomerase [Microbacterium phyllosphaerae]